MIRDDYKGVHEEAVRINREIILKHLIYTFVYIFSSRKLRCQK